MGVIPQVWEKLRTSATSGVTALNLTLSQRARGLPQRDYRPSVTAMGVGPFDRLRML